MKIPPDTKPGLMPNRGAAGARYDDPTLGPFIVSLCALPGPAVPQLPAAQLVGLRPFVSRRTGLGGERFYLHVGFFQTLGESEAWLNTVRTEYPNAFASKLPHGPRSGEPEAALLPDTQVLKVLQVRRPNEEGAPAESTANANSYAVRTQVRVLGTEPSTPAPVASPRPSPAPQPKREVKKASRGLSADLNDLALAEFKLANADLSSTTGVRHLRVEIQRKPKAPVKSFKGRKV